MIKIPCGDKHYWMDGIVYKNLQAAKQIIKDDWDFLYVIDGKVGSGKSVFAQQLAYFVSEGNFSVDHICFNANQFREAILKADKYSAVVFDEAFRGLAGRASMSTINRSIVELLNEIRQKNLFVFIVLPSMWDLDKYVTMHRCSGVFHVYYLKQKTPGGLFKRQRGHVRFYKEDKISWLIGNSKVRYIYPKESNFKITFREFYPVEKEIYKQKKLEALASGERERKDAETTFTKRLKDQRKKLTEFCRELGMNDTELAQKLGVARKSLRVWAGNRSNSSFLDPQDGVVDDENVQQTKVST